MSDPVWRCRDRSLPVFDRVHIMGILNVTPDSFSDGGLFASTDEAVKHGITMAKTGADIVDVGGESTRPGADPVDAAEEIRRVVPVIAGLVSNVNSLISVDTTKADVAEAALDAGAHIVNDVSALRFDQRMAKVAAVYEAGVVLMHMQGEPRTMQGNPKYGDVVAEVGGALAGWAADAESAGIAAERIAIDPGIGFGKDLNHNLTLLKRLGALKRAAGPTYPLLVGPSRKSFIGAVLDAEVDERLEGTAAAVALAVAGGANILRVHDVPEMIRVVRMSEAILGANQ